MNSPYDAGFYNSQSGRSLASARATLKHLWTCCQPQSVIDVGCGSGSWLKVAGELGASKLAGLEGDWLTEKIALVPFEQIIHTDLSKPFAVPQAFDLAISMEVAEHLPAERGPGFVKDITRLAKIVLFSAAVPGQGGTNHLNEQWPEYWADLFAKEGYLSFDFIRKGIWTNSDVAFWYAQNAIVYIEESYFRATPALVPLAPSQVRAPLSLVHPNFLERTNQPDLKRVLFDFLPGALRRSIQRRLKKDTQY